MIVIMGEVIVITSGKGGVGKTTTTANLGSSLAVEGKKVVLCAPTRKSSKENDRNNRRRS